MNNKYINPFQIKYNNKKLLEEKKTKYLNFVSIIDINDDKHSNLLLEKQKYNIVFSINVHEKIDFLLKQLDNIKSYVRSNYCIILNCNQFMYNNLLLIKLDSNIYINNITIEKKRFYGSLFNGIYTNMLYAMDHFIFDYFIVLSSRNIFYNYLHLDQLNKLNDMNRLNCSTIEEFNNKMKNIPNIVYNEWWMTDSDKLDSNFAKKYLSNNFSLYHAEHEGLTLSYNVSNNIINFLNNNVEIKNELINLYYAVEEVALHTISMNEINLDNNEHGFIQIGCGINTDVKFPDRFIYKIERI